MNRIIAIITAALVAIALPVFAGDVIKVATETEKPGGSSKRRLYMPPANLAPLREKTRVQSGATRSARAPTTLRAVAPEHTGFTIKAQPTLFWYSSRRVDVPVEIVIEAAEGPLAAPLVDKRFQPPFEAGLHSVSLAELGISLETGREYSWRVIVVVDEARRSNDVYAGANIARVQEPEAFASTLSSASAEEHPRIYASAGLWYDALSSIERLRHAASDGAKVRADCRDLLDEQSLQQVSCP